MRRSALLLAILASCGPGPAPDPAPEPQAEPAGAPEPEAVPGTPAPRARPRSKYDPPATLGHLDTTRPEQRREIDDLIVVMFDVEAGRESLAASATLAAISKPAFLPVLGRMAQVRDTITDNETMEERLLESSLKLADQCLREMDGYLDEHDKAPIRPGTDKKYIDYILRLHYRHWLDGLGSEPLRDRDGMPGPFK
jgi:hypothetical protein